MPAGMIEDFDLPDVRILEEDVESESEGVSMVPPGKLVVLMPATPEEGPIREDPHALVIDGNVSRLEQSMPA